MTPAWMIQLLALALSLVGCNFETQPLFSVSYGDGGTGHGAGSTGNGGMPPNSGRDAPNTPDTGTTTSTGSGDAGGLCTPAQVMSCSDGVALTCRADGLGFSGVTCGRAGCNAAGSDCYSCRPGERTCNGVELLTCDADGGATQGQSCDHGCGGAPAACLTCNPGATSCEAGQLSTCALDGMTTTQSACAHGCDAARHACALTRLQPVNLSVDVCSGDDIADRSFSGNVMIDTDGDCSFVQHQANAAEICVLRYRDIHVEVGALVKAVGSRAFALVATGQFVMEGSLSVSASGPTDGAGAAHSGNGADAISVSTDPSMNDPGQADAPANAAGGGGGFAVSGGLGGDAPGDCSQSDRPCADPGAGGLAYGSVLVKPLLGGSSGGRNSAVSGSTRQAMPGGAGGALQLVACGELQIAATGRILAAGGGGGGGTPGTVANASPTPGGGAGGGSGGAILIEAARLTASAGAIIAANGGGGGGGASRGGGNSNGGGPGPSGMGMGMMRFAPGGDGQDGQASQDQAAGGLGARDSAPGGAGGTRLPPAAGTSVSQQDVAAGGGGGAAGRIRIEAGLIPLLDGVIVSPAPSTGAVLLVPLS